MATRIVPVTHLPGRLLDEVADLGEDTMVVTDDGAPVAVLVSTDRWNALQDSFEDLLDIVAVLGHRVNPEATVPAEEVFAAIEDEVAGLVREGRGPGVGR
jgi:hypothetical protein